MERRIKMKMFDHYSKSRFLMANFIGEFYLKVRDTQNKNDILIEGMDKEQSEDFFVQSNIFQLAYQILDLPLPLSEEGELDINKAWDFIVDK